MKSWLSRYGLSYPRSIAYMLQASEYNVRDYLAWYRDTKDFSQVERRKRLVGTPKGRLMLSVAWSIFMISLVIAVLSFFLLPTPASYVLFVLILLAMPYLVAYGVIVPLVVIESLIQRPIERVVTGKARIKLRAHKAVKIGIAGSFGKTTMREILRTVLSEGMKVAAPPHSYNTPIGISRFVETLEGDEEILIFEMGEHYPGDVRELCELVDPDIGIITGVNEAHLERSGSLERTVAMIYEIADHLGDRPLYVNGESELARKNARPGNIIYDRNRVGEWRIVQPSTDLSGTSFVMERDVERMRMRSELLGLHQIGPIAAAAIIALRLGSSPERIEAGIERTKPFDHRLKPKVDPSGVITLDDSYNGNPDGVAAVIDFLSSLEGRRRFYVTPGLVEMGHRTEGVHREIGARLAKAGIEKVVLIRNSVTPYIEEGLKEAGYGGEIVWFDDAISAFTALPLLTAKGDVVLLQNDWPDQYR